MLHSNAPAGDVHLPFNWVVANATARAALTVTLNDVYKALYQIDTGKVYILTDDSPVTWTIVNPDVAPSSILTTHVKRNATQSANNGVDTLVSFDTEISDTANAWVIGTPTRITTPAAVTKARITAQLAWASNSTNNRAVTIFKNGTTIVVQQDQKAFSNSNMVITSGLITVTPGDYFTLSAYQDSGGSLNIFGDASNFTFMLAEFS